MIWHIPNTTSVPRNEAASADNTASRQHTAPSFDTYRNNPAGYAHAMEQHFDRDAGQLQKHMMEQPAEAQTALVDHSELLRSYLRIGHVSAFPKLWLRSPPGPRIPYTEAPAALALAATRVTADTRVDRLLDALADVLEKNPVGDEPDTRDGCQYKKSVETAFAHLLENFKRLPKEGAQRKASDIIRTQFNQLSPAAKETIRLAVRQPLSDPTISNELKTGLRGFDIPSTPSLPTEIHLNILKKLTEVTEESARKDGLTQDQVKRAAARGLANMRLLSKSYSNVVQGAINDDPEIGTARTRNTINTFSRLDDKTFEQKVLKLFSENRHIGIDFHRLSENKKQIVLDQLVKTTRGHLGTLELCGEKPIPAVMQALQRVTQNNPRLKISMDLGGGAISDAEVTALADILPKYKVTSLNLGKTHINTQGIITLAGALQLSQVTDLNLNNCHRIGTQGIFTLASALQQSKITNLDLSGTNMDAAAAAAFAFALPQTAITHLKLSCNGEMGSQGVTAIAGALPQSKVTNLDMSDCRIDQQDAAAIADVLPNSRLTVLDLSKNPGIGAQGATAIAGTLAQSNVTDLNLSGTEMDPQAAVAVGQALPQSKVTVLDVSDNNIGVQGATAIAGALPQSEVTALNLSKSRIGLEGITAIANALPQSKVTRLNLSGCQIDRQAAVAIAAALRQSNVTDLDLSNCYMNHEAVAIIAEALPQSKVTHLNMSNNRIAPEGAIALAAALPNSKVTHLDLSKCHIGSQGTEAIAKELPRSGVTHLNLENNDIGPEGARAIAGKLPQSQVKDLNLSDNTIGAAGGFAIAGALPRSRVTQVQLKGNALGDRAAVALIKVMPPQEKLDLSNNNLGSDTAIAIAKRLLKSSDVNNLNLSGNRIDRRGAKALADALPYSNVNYLDLSFNDSRKKGTKIGDGITLALAQTLQQTKLAYLDLRESFVGNLGGTAIINAIPGSNLSTLGLRTNNGLDPQLHAVIQTVAATHPFTLL